MTITVITGANKGLGYETARRLIERGHTVYVGARDAARGERAAGELGARPLLIDVTDEDSVRAAAETVRAGAGRVDLLVNNAGITGRPVRPDEPEVEVMRRVYETNVFGPVRTVHAFLPLLSGPDAVVVNVSSGLGSVGVAADPALRASLRGWAPFPAYASSKAALNMLSVLYAQTFPGVDFRAVDPGYTATDFNGHRGFQTVEEGARSIVEVAVGERKAGPLFAAADGDLPW
ncbi:SDR family NAD(P)-dependent oxidoreductase [Streptomyces fuscigenes]|uniref:SDR family NAD(P)-dependent oxidoreductase n=1 Tax=Streptomyces fuscigenes TaxID=1528880 RepID=UPI001F3F29CB|nr:SDR family NAD(P)-dependent oxidoreductase [Streptomyces fuscigenes]MCF3962910.1 SDR family NAD(P)-dependent oxidoreductase [Streptomyces fuscigenes]